MLFGDAPLPPHNGRPTSKAAAASVAESAESMRAEIMRLFDRLGDYGATCDEAEQALRLRHQTCSARIAELKKAGSIVDSGRTRKTRSGCKAAVMVAAGRNHVGSERD